MKILWTRPALAQLAEAREYIEADNPRAAAETADRIETAVHRLRVFPLMGRPGRRTATRELMVAGTPYIVVYRVRSEGIQIVTILNGARRRPETS